MQRVAIFHFASLECEAGTGVSVSHELRKIMLRRMFIKAKRLPKDAGGVPGDKDD